MEGARDTLCVSEPPVISKGVPLLLTLSGQISRLEMTLTEDQGSLLPFWPQDFSRRPASELLKIADRPARGESHSLRVPGSAAYNPSSSYYRIEVIRRVLNF